MNDLSWMIQVSPNPIILHDRFVVKEVSASFKKLFRVEDFSNIGLDEWLRKQFRSGEPLNQLIEGISKGTEITVQVPEQKKGAKFLWHIQSLPIPFPGKEGGGQITWFVDDSLRAVQGAYWDLNVRMSAITSQLMKKEAQLAKTNFDLKKMNEQLELDIGERKKIEVALKENEEWFSTLLKSIGDGVIATDAKGHVAFMNKVAEDLTGWKQAEAAGKFLDEVFHIVNEETRKKVESPVAKVLEKGIVVGLSNHTVLISKDGKEIPLNDSGAPIRNAEGKIVGVVLVFQDVTERRKAEEELKNSEERLKMLFNSSPDLVFVANLKGVFLEVNKEFEKLTGYQSEEIIGKSFLNFPIIPANQLPKVAGLLTRFVAGQDIGAPEVIIKHKSGRLVAVEIKVFPIKIKGETLILCNARNIAERKQAEEALRASEERYRGIIEDQTDLICRFKPDGMLTFINPAYCRYYGKREDELVGHNFIPWIPKEEAEEIRRALLQLSPEKPTVLMEHRVILPNGETRWQSWTHRAVFDEKGRQVECQGTGHDITDQKRAELALVATTEKFQALFESAPDAILVIGKDGNVQQANSQAAKLFGYSVQEMKHVPVETFIPKRFRDRHIQHRNQFMADPHGRPMGMGLELFGMRKDGSEFAVDVTLGPLKTSQEELVLCIVRDITDRKEEERILQEDKEKIAVINRELLANDRLLRATLNEAAQTNDELKKTQTQLIQADRLSAIGQLAAGIAHEINNPVGFVSSNLSTLDKYIGSFAEILRAVDKLKESVAKEQSIEKANQIVHEMESLEEKLNINFILNDIDALMRESQSGVERVKKIVNDLKTFARSDKNVLAPEDLNKVIEGMISIVWNEIKYKAELKKEYGDIPLVNCNSQQLGQVIINMLVNAAQAIASMGVITIRTYVKEKWVCIEIEDTGKGIPKEVVGKVFDPFFTTKDPGKGTGLGLSISYDIVKKHNGTIEVASEVGKGTKFIISLPIEPGPEGGSDGTPR